MAFVYIKLKLYKDYRLTQTDATVYAGLSNHIKIKTQKVLPFYAYGRNTGKAKKLIATLFKKPIFKFNSKRGN